MARTEKGKRAINVGVIATGWCGGIRAEACAKSPFVKGTTTAGAIMAPSDPPL